MKMLIFIFIFLGLTLMPRTCAAELSDDIVCEARRWCETYSPYEYAAAGEEPGSATDCSGLVMRVFEKFGTELPHSSYDIALLGKEVNFSDISDLRSGDVLIMNDYGHCGIYSGGGKMIHASSACGRVIEADFDIAAIDTVRRFTDSAEPPPLVTRFCAAVLKFTLNIR